MDKNLISEVICIVVNTLRIPPSDGKLFNTDSALLGFRPELDSMAVVGLLTTIEEHFDISINDDEISAEVFETIGTLTGFVERKLSE